MFKNLPLETLIPADYNPRVISDKALNHLVQSLFTYGVVEPIVWNEATGCIVGGHQRVAAIHKAIAQITQKLDVGDYAEGDRKSLEDRLLELQRPPVMVVSIDESQEKALNLALNKISGDWDTNKLAEVLSDIASQSLPTGFDQSEIDELLALYQQEAEAEPKTDDDAVPEVDESQIITRKGDIWLLGSHRLMCGDSTKQSDIDQLLEGHKADMVFTDPPYLMKYEGAMGKGGRKKQRHKIITNDDLNQADGDQFLREVCRSVKNNCSGAWYISFYRLGIDRLYQAMALEGLKWRNLVIWAKEHFTLSNSDYKSQYEPIFVGWDDDYTPIFYGWNEIHEFQGSKGEHDIWEIELPSVWQINRTKKNDLHPTIKPVALCERAIVNSSRPGQQVLDLFGGSGSTLIACQKSARRARLMELEPVYCDVIIKRWEEYTGKQAKKQAP